MPYGYLGTTPNQQKANSGVFSVEEALALQNVGELGGSLELIEEQSITSSTASMIFSSIKESLYDVHFLQFSNFKPNANNPRLVLRFFESGVEETASVYEYALQMGSADGTLSAANSTGADAIHLGSNQDSAGVDISNGYIYIYNAGNSSKYTLTTQQITEIYYSGTHYRYYFGGGVLPQASSVNQIKLFTTTDNIAKLSAKLYGVKQI